MAKGALLALALGVLEPEQERVLERASAYAQEYEARLPDFVCRQVTRSSESPTEGKGQWKLRSITEEELTYHDRQESRRLVALNGRVVKKNRRSGRFASSGEFAYAVRDIFDSASKAEFRWVSGATGQCVLGYRIDRANSRFHVNWGGRHVTLGYHGTVVTDCATGAIRRFEIEAEDIPTLPVSQVVSFVEFADVQIYRRTDLLPSRSRLMLHDRFNWLLRDIEFRDYHKYDAEAVIQYEPPK